MSERGQTERWGGLSYADMEAIARREQSVRDAAVHLIEELAKEIAEVCYTDADYGDDGAWTVEILRNALREQFGSRPQGYRKKKISNTLRTQVFERDEYACRKCGVRKNLRADHIVPERGGGPATLENLQTLCASCNSSKGVKSNEEFGL
ncbi:HNH endonuclease [Rhodococcus sp. NPDC049939]|uniref:HNH endonuclease n=1 Tax=Rhodococcus sp. NPDC049939 TaxID=3155511 RepID=UPI00340FE61A